MRKLMLYMGSILIMLALNTGAIAESSYVFKTISNIPKSEDVEPAWYDARPISSYYAVESTIRYDINCPIKNVSKIKFKTTFKCYTHATSRDEASKYIDIVEKDFEYWIRLTDSKAHGLKEFYIDLNREEGYQIYSFKCHCNTEILEGEDINGKTIK